MYLKATCFGGTDYESTQFVNLSGLMFCGVADDMSNVMGGTYFSVFFVFNDDSSSIDVAFLDRKERDDFFIRVKEFLTLKNIRYVNFTDEAKIMGVPNNGAGLLVTPECQNFNIFKTPDDDNYFLVKAMLSTGKLLTIAFSKKAAQDDFLKELQTTLITH